MRISPPAAVVVAASGLALLTAACGGSAHHAKPVTQANGSLVMARCMRSHGVSSFPDPNGNGTIDKTKIAPLTASPGFQTAEKACGHLLPNTNPPRATHAEVQAALSGMVRFAACIRSAGVQGWPDPTVDRYHPGDPRPVFDLPSTAVNPSAPRIRTAIQGCSHLMPGGTTPYVCSRALAEQIPGSPPGAEACDGGSPSVP